MKSNLWSFIFLLSTVFSIPGTSLARVVSIQTTSNGNVYFLFETKASAEETLAKICGDRELPPIQSLPKKYAQPSLPWELSPVLERSDTRSDFAQILMPTYDWLNNLNRVWSYDEFVSLPDPLYFADLASCFPAHILPLLDSNYEFNNKANCFNSALNFGEPREITFVSEVDFALELSRKYRPIAEHELQFGDLIVYFYNEEPRHAYVWLTPDWGWTKNGKEPRERHRFQRRLSTSSIYSERDEQGFFRLREFKE